METKWTADNIIDWDKVAGVEMLGPLREYLRRSDSLGSGAARLSFAPPDSDPKYPTHRYLLDHWPTTAVRVASVNISSALLKTAIVFMALGMGLSPREMEMQKEMAMAMVRWEESAEVQAQLAIEKTQIAAWMMENIDDPEALAVAKKHLTGLAGER